MLPLLEAYGVHALEQWQLRRRLPSWDSRRRNLEDLKESSAAIGARPAADVKSFAELIDVVAFLSVMNKRYSLLYRGQSRDRPLLPTLFRDQWMPPPGRDQGPVDLVSVRSKYWATLPQVESVVLRVLDEQGLPRWRHVHKRRQARWAVIQHYELWPTPVLDFTTSLRVAASFAFGLGPCEEVGHLYVVAVRDIRGDLMELPPPVGQVRAVDDDVAEVARDAQRDTVAKPPDPEPEVVAANKRLAESRVLALRLNSVCPPDAVRPHLQEGVLIGRYPFEDVDLVSREPSDAASILVAKLRLVNAGGKFWSSDYPIHSTASLLPSEDQDPLLAKLREATEGLRVS